MARKKGLSQLVLDVRLCFKAQLLCKRQDMTKTKDSGFCKQLLPCTNALVDCLPALAEPALLPSTKI